MACGSIDSQDAFQVKMDQILEGHKGVVSIADDIVVHGVTEEPQNNNTRNSWRELRRMVLYSTLTNAY